MHALEKRIILEQKAIKRRLDLQLKDHKRLEKEKKDKNGGPDEPLHSPEKPSFLYDNAGKKKKSTDI